MGEILWDLIGGREHLGGAVLNLSVNAMRLGHEVSFLSAVGDDARGAAALARVRALGLPAGFIQTVPGRATGTVTVEVDSSGQPSYVIHRPAAYDFVELDDSGLAQLAAFDPDWIGYGTLHAMDPGARRLLRKIVERCPRARRFYDINLRNNSYSSGLVEEWMRLADFVKLNEDEMREVQKMQGGKALGREAFCRTYAGRYGWRGACITRGEQGCALLLDGAYVEEAVPAAHVADTVGAGDAFAAALLHGMQAGRRPREIAGFANRLGALVASRAGALPEWAVADLL